MSQALSTPHKLTLVMLIITWLAFLTVCVTFEIYLKDILIPNLYMILLWVILALDSVITLYLFVTSIRCTSCISCIRCIRCIGCCNRNRFQSGSDRNDSHANDQGRKSEKNKNEDGEYIIRVDDTDDDTDEIHSFAE